MAHRQDPNRFVSYYENQVGGTLPGFYGSPVMYGRGIGSIFSKLFRFVAPLMKKGFAIAKPHLKAAAKNIASDVVTNAVSKLGSRGEASQEGSGGIMVLARRARKRPPGRRVTRESKKPRRTGRKKSVGRGSLKRKKSAKSRVDIFS